ncbi:putative C6 transcription factor [Aspergillus mulundensis]|uniref:Putative Zn(II)2Cys6 transcription factor n=1 Tax=Aspergillus mulundensis TaxID=1810919 RepID=A0A3D8SJI1_9EURO|nr:putative Zn(II)2Cys6 transcription factor [Aspergillus mulundensis]RDW86499.1 putative Zn(II)2Cys6 transcription factor [Aspergillus mulundensis]
MTKDASQAQAQAQSRPAKRARTESSHTPSPASTAAPPSASASTPTVQYGLRQPEQQRPSTTPGYLGSTSFSAVFSEHRTDISFEEGTCAPDGVFSKSTDHYRLESGLEVIRFLYRHPVCETLIRKFYAGHLMAAVSVLIIEAILQSIRRIFDELDRAKDTEKHLRDLVQRIFQASAHPLTSHASMTVDEYFASFTDANLRWEVVGLVLATAGIAMMSTADSDPDVQKAAPEPQGAEMLRTQLVEASRTCLLFCATAASVNELLGFYQYNDMLLRTQYYGDTSYAAWRKLGNLTATIYAAGLHQENTRGANCPPFLHQWRKISFAAAFYADKSLSTFVGRPPFINYRYCSISAPLDIRDEDLIAGGEQLSQAMANINGDGWNMKGNTLRGSMLRLRFHVAVLREQALEIALGTFDDEAILRKYNELIQAAQNLWQSCPVYLRHDQYVHNEGNPEPPNITFARRHIYLDYLYTVFLVQRMVAKRTNTGHEALFNTSREVLAIILEVTGERHPGVDVLYYGLPSASTLAFELLRQTQEPGPHPVMPPRPETIRNLSVFVSCLSWVATPGQGNYRTCKAVEKKLSDILDQILDPKPDPQPVQGFLDGNAGGGYPDHDAAGLYSLLNWYNPDSIEFDPFEFPVKDGFLL